MQMIRYPGAVAQLNMGEGKNRVIVPMLVLHWARNDGDHILQLHALTAILDELVTFLHNHLTASVLHRKIFTLPFHRDILLNIPNALMMHRYLSYCRDSGGVLVVAPEHRLSLELKWHELRMQSKSNAALKALDSMLKCPFRELFDECDEILRNRFQLVYAVGSEVALESGKERWCAAASLLRILYRDLCEDSARTALYTESICEFKRLEYQQFPHFRFIPSAELDLVSDQWKLQLGEALLHNPPYEFRWLEKYSADANTRALVLEFVVSQDVTGSVLRDQLPGAHWSVLLAFRGLLAHGVLQHCLEKRHRVDFGTYKLHRKKLAIPYRACETPAERSEYGHPDCAIVLTYLSYYYTGLTLAQLRNGFEILLQLGSSAQKEHYSTWFMLSRKGMSDSEESSLDSVSKLDLTNQQQLLLLFKHYRHNYEVVNFFLEYSIFPTETMQYPGKLMANAWHLAQNAENRVNGFSGTNDTKKVMPRQVQQHTLEQLCGTNGKMVQTVLENEDLLITGIGWQELVDLAVEN